jgi:hypothetical protein
MVAPPFPTWAWLVFFGLVLLVLDLFVFHRNAREVPFNEAHPRRRGRGVLAHRGAYPGRVGGRRRAAARVPRGLRGAPEAREMLSHRRTMALSPVLSSAPAGEWEGAMRGRPRFWPLGEESP